MLSQLGNLAEQLIFFVVVWEYLKESKVNLMRVFRVKLPFENQLH